MGGSITAELTSAEPTALLRKLMNAGLELRDVGEITGLSVSVTFGRNHLPLLKSICKADGAKVRVLRSVGFFRLLRRIIRRPVLASGCMVIVALSLYLPTKVLFIEVDGAGVIPVDQILQKAESCGIRLGADRSEIRSEKVKNALLETMPELQWVGINTYGCRAVISVRQRTQVQTEEAPKGISSLVAVRDGVIREMTVLQGVGLCKVGQSVTKDQVLISGYTDLGICLRGTQAQGEVFAETQRTIRAISPSKVLRRTGITAQEKKYSLIFGNFRINFFKGSGISDTTCDKMYVYHYMTLPGGFRLPVALAVEESRQYDSEEDTLEKATAAKLLSDRAGAYLQQQMIAGRVEHRYEIVTVSEGAYYQVGKYACYEMIGTSRPEEDLNTNEINGTNGECGAG